MPRKPGISLMPPGQLAAALAKLPAEEDFWVTLAPAGRPPVTVRLGFAPDGRLCVTGLLVAVLEPTEITARALRDIPLAEITAMAADPKALGPAAQVILGGAASAAAPLRRPRMRPGPRGHPREHFEHVAARYRAALQRTPRSPVTTLTKELHASEATVRRWLQQARAMGLLGPAPIGKAGEEPAKEGR